MENNTFKSVTFGGFAKQDVVDYIEKMARENTAVQEGLQQENDGLREANTTLEEENAALRKQVESLTAELNLVRGAVTRESSTRQALEESKIEVERLAAETERLRPDAEAYAQFRERIGAIECEARKRAADLEEESRRRMEQTVHTFQNRYQELMGTFEATSAHVNSELRKMEVNLTQLPRAMDQSGTALKELEGLLSKK